MVRQLYEEENLETAYRESLKLEEIAERLVLVARTLPAYTGFPFAAKEVKQVISACVPVQMGFTAEGWFCLLIPALLPKKEAGSADYIRSFLYPAMQDFFRGQPPVRYEDCVLAYRHVYDHRRPVRRRRDHDNIETNMVSDILALYLLPDDGPAVCSHYACSTAGPEDRTEVYVVPQKDFPRWLAAEKFMPEKGVRLYQNRPEQP